MPSEPQLLWRGLPPHWFGSSPHLLPLELLSLAVQVLSGSHEVVQLHWQESELQRWQTGRHLPRARFLQLGQPVEGGFGRPEQRQGGQVALVGAAVVGAAVVVVAGGAVVVVGAAVVVVGAAVVVVGAAVVVVVVGAAVVVVVVGAGVVVGAAVVVVVGAGVVVVVVVGAGVVVVVVGARVVVVTGSVVVVVVGAAVVGAAVVVTGTVVTGRVVAGAVVTGRVVSGAVVFTAVVTGAVVVWAAEEAARTSSASRHSGKQRRAERMGSLQEKREDGRMLARMRWPLGGRCCGRYRKAIDRASSEAPVKYLSTIAPACPRWRRVQRWRPRMSAVSTVGGKSRVQRTSNTAP
jgi:hypothetical protein